ncbi:MAG: hypothetical protein J6A20_00815 [Muribaculaceae bacterium]|nr:hypothetical protein [Muribaculaceae bacterium]
MKIINLRSNLPVLDIEIHPDSTVVMSGRPLFLPEDGKEMIAEGHIAVRISRLGKNISAKFASRYYDAVTVMLRVIPADGVPEGMEGVYSAMDASSVMGVWHECELIAAPFKVTLDGKCFDFAPLSKDIDALIHDISRYITLKIGDVLMLPPFAKTSPLKASTHLTSSLNEVEAIDVKIV